MLRPVFDQHKFDSLVLYIVSQCPDPARLGEMRLRKILYFADATHYLRTGRPLTGATYVKWEHAPMPQELDAALQRLQQADKLRVRQGTDPAGYPITAYLALATPDIRAFGADEISRIDTLIRTNVAERRSTPISEWIRNRAFEVIEIGEVLPYESFLIWQFAEITPEDIAWARREIARVEDRPA